LFAGSQRYAPEGGSLHRIDPDRNMARYCELSVESTLFGDYAAVRRRGRIDSRGQARETWRRSPAEARGQAPPRLRADHSDGLIMLVGYARVPTQDQDPALQLDALKAASCEKVFVEKASGAQRDRPELEAALNYMRKGDMLVVWRLATRCKVRPPCPADSSVR
jgi:predicted DNA-binding WGR domain protein